MINSNKEEIGNNIVNMIRQSPIQFVFNTPIKNNSIAEKHEPSLLIASKNEHRQNKMAQSPFVNWSKLMVNLFTPLVNYQFFLLSAVNFSKIKSLKHLVK